MVSRSAREAPAHPAYRRVKFTAERTGGEAPCPLCAPQRPPPTGCRAMPAQARGLMDRPSIWGALAPDSQHCHRPEGSLAHTSHSSHRAASPPNEPCHYSAAVPPALPHDRQVRNASPGSPIWPGGWKQPCLRPRLGIPPCRSSGGGWKTRFISPWQDGILLPIPARGAAG